MGPHEPPGDPLLRMVAERRPELAERLETLLQRSPERFHRVLAEALLSRLEDTLNEAEREPLPERSEGPMPPGPGMRHGPGMEPESSPEQRSRVRELEQRQQDLETRSQELATRLRELRAKGAAAEEQTKAREELTRALNEQFDVRTELRKVELERIQRELDRLHGMLEKMQRDAEQRDRERSAIIERRVGQLLDDKATGW